MEDYVDLRTDFERTGLDNGPDCQKRRAEDCPIPRGRLGQDYTKISVWVSQ